MKISQVIIIASCLIAGASVGKLIAFLLIRNGYSISRIIEVSLNNKFNILYVFLPFVLIGLIFRHYKNSF